MREGDVYREGVEMRREEEDRNRKHFASFSYRASTALRIGTTAPRSGHHSARGATQHTRASKRPDSLLMKQVLGINNEPARMKVAPPLAVASFVHGDDMRWNPNWYFS